MLFHSVPLPLGLNFTDKKNLYCRQSSMYCLNIQASYTRYYTRKIRLLVAEIENMQYVQNSL